MANRGWSVPTRTQGKKRQKLGKGEVLPLDRSLLMGDFSVSLSGGPTTRGNRMRPVKVFEISLLRGHSVLLTVHCEQNGLKEPSMSPMKRYVKKQAKARQRRRLQ